MTTSRAAYRIDPNHPGSDLAGETAAAMAAASMVFRRYNPSYSAELLKHAYQVHLFSVFHLFTSEQSLSFSVNGVCLVLIYAYFSKRLVVRILAYLYQLIGS